MLYTNVDASIISSKHNQVPTCTEWLKNWVSSFWWRLDKQGCPRAFVRKACQKSNHGIEKSEIQVAICTEWLEQ